MTTAPQTTRTGPRPGVTGPVVRRALLITLVVGLLAALLGLAVGGAPALVGALIGTAMVCIFFGVGAVVLDVATALAPALSMLVALLTYALKVVLIGLVFVGLNRSGLLDSSIDPKWLGGTVIAGTLTWVVSQVAASTRTRIPVYELGDTNRLQEGPEGPAGEGPERQEAGDR